MTEPVAPLVPLDRLRGVVWDCNGVLADDEPVHRAAFAEVVSATTGAVMPDEVYDEECFHRTDADGVAGLLARGLLAGDPDRLVRAKQDAYYAMVRDPDAIVVPGARRVLSMLSGAGVAMVMVTASTPRWTTWFLGGTGLDALLPPQAVTAGAYGEARYEAIARHAAAWPAGTGLLVDDADDHLERGRSLGLHVASVRTDGTRSRVAVTLRDLDALADAWAAGGGAAAAPG